jgi:hypothetical protein
LIRDCTIYTRRGDTPGNMEVPYGGFATGIYLEDSANLTMVNVKVVPHIDINVAENASLKMVNVTDWGTGWYGGFGTGETFSRNYFGLVSAIGSPMIWVEGSEIGGLGSGTGDARVTVIDSWFAASSMKRLALKAGCSMNKTEYRAGEAIQMSFRVENVGEETVNLDSGYGNFWMTAFKYDASSGGGGTYDPYWDSGLPSDFKPSDVFTQTLTWTNPPLWPGKYWIQGGITSRGLDLSVMLEKYLVTVS